MQWLRFATGSVRFLLFFYATIRWKYLGVATRPSLRSEAFVCFPKLMTFLSFSDSVAAAEPAAQGLRKLPEAIEWSYSGPYQSNLSDVLPIL